LKNCIRAFLLLTVICFPYFNLKAHFIDEHGFWVGNDVQCEHVYDAKLSAALLSFFQSQNANSIVDFGCGLGSYVKSFCENQLDAEGYDGNPNTIELTNGQCGIIDLSAPFSLGKSYDWVMSLEVGEHLPPQFERVFIENLIRHCKNGIVLSWAVQGQGGYGHFNEQNNDYIKKIFADYGFTNDVEAENVLRDNVSENCGWFKNTIMVFHRTPNT
jgi:2-polyprenyl-3-methyl-5-hydroxy-6-metoxy-1,4-benzoquinol methylase